MENKRALVLCVLFALSVTVLIGVIGVWAMGNILMSPSVTPKSLVTEADLKSLHTAVIMFRLDTGRYPSQEKGLTELVEQPADVTGWAPGGYLESTDVPRDAWKHEYIYKLTPEGEHPFVILSYGADARPGGTDKNADLDNTNLYNPSRERE